MPLPSTPVGKAADILSKPYSTADRTTMQPARKQQGVKLTDHSTSIPDATDKTTDNLVKRNQNRQARIDKRDTLKQAMAHVQAPSQSNPLSSPHVKPQSSDIVDKVDQHLKIANSNHTRISKPINHGRVLPSTTKHTLGIAPQKIILRRKFGKQIKYKVKFADDDFEWLDASKIDQTLLSLYNVQRYQKLQEKKNRKTLNFNQG
jgi:hypothetical protein